MIPFIDISSHQQGPLGIDWPAVAQYLLNLHPEAGVIIKATEGTDYVNPFFHQQRMGAHAAGIKNVGLYIYAKPSTDSGQAEADFFMQTIGDDGGVLPLEFYCVDLEDPDVPGTADLDAFVLDLDGRIARPFGHQIIAYSADYYRIPHDLSRDPRLAELGLWEAAPGPKLPAITPEPWRSAGKQILLWQSSWHGHVPGIVGEVDLDYLVGGIETLRPYQWGSPPAPFDPNTTDVPLDVDGVAANSEDLNDMKRVVAVTKQHADEIIAAPVGANVSAIAAKMKSEIDWLVRASWGR